jgi:hypothetical protein
MADTAITDDSPAYLASQGLWPGPLPTAQAPATAQPPPPPPEPPPDHTSEFPRYQPEFPPGTRQPPVPQLQQIDVARFAPPGPQYENPIAAFQNPMVILAGLGSLFTRRPLTTALNAGAAAMNGYHQGQKDVYEQNKAQFDEQLKVAMEQNRIELAKYKDAWDRKREFNWDQVAPKMYEQAARTGDTLMTQALNSHNWDLVEKIMLGREQADNAYTKAFEAQDARDRAQQAQIDRWTQDPGIIDRVKQIRALKASPPPQSSRNPQNQAIWQLLSEADPNTGEVYDVAQFSKRQGATLQLAKPTPNNMGGKSVSVRAVTGHLGELDELIDALEQAKITGNFVPANQVSVAIRRANSYPEITNYEIGADIASKELVKAIVPGGGGEAERVKMEQNLSVDHGPNALHQAANTLRGFLRVQYEALEGWATENHAEDTFAGVVGRNTKAILEGKKPVPTEDDRKLARSRPELHDAFVKHFGVEP